MISRAEKRTEKHHVASRMGHGMAAALPAGAFFLLFGVTAFSEGGGIGRDDEKNGFGAAK